MTPDQQPIDRALTLDDLEQVAGGMAADRDVATGQASGLCTNEVVKDVVAKKASQDFLIKN